MTLLEPEIMKFPRPQLIGDKWWALQIRIKNGKRSYVKIKMFDTPKEAEDQITDYKLEYYK